MKSSKASALILSFLLMTLLLGLSLSVSVIVLKDIRAVRTFVAGKQALYAAEGMSELGLLTLAENLPGYEPSFTDYHFTSAALASMEITARGQVVPCDQAWRAISPNESVQLPLFAQIDQEGNTEKVEQFYVEFYVGDENGNVSLPPRNDVLRWKILGLQNLKTEAISEYIPLDWTNNRTSQSNPSKFGSSLAGSVPTGYSYAKYYDSGYPSVFYPTYPIGRFLADHSYNYLVLTNVVQRSGSENIIYFRLHAENPEAVCEYTELSSTADVEFGEARQLLKTTVKEGENLPVFDFVLYHTAE